MSEAPARPGRWLWCATSVLMAWVASAACLPQRLSARSEVAHSSAETARRAASPPSADALPSTDADAEQPSGEAAVSNGNDPVAPQEAADTSAPSTWIIPTDTTPPARRETPPLLGDIAQISVVGHPAAFLSLPTGATAPRPVIIVIHGAGDRPERQCRGWRNATKGFPFIICPTGRAWPRYTHIGGAPLLDYIDQALGAVEARYPDYVDTKTPLLAGFSLGAAQVTALAAHHPDRFPRVALVEGATKVWSSARASAFSQGGGQRVLFACGQDGVRDTAERTAKRLGGVGLEAHVVFANAGHRFGGPLQEAVRSELGWLLEGDDRWSGAPWLESVRSASTAN